MMVATNGAMAQYSYRFSDELGTYRVKFTPHKETKFKAPTTKPLLPTRSSPALQKAETA